jgi:excisionase family DNA binding protein
MSLPPHEFLTLDEVAAHIRVDTKTVRRWVTAGILPMIRIGKHTLRIRRRDLQKLLSESRTKKKRGAKLRGSRIND